MQLMERIDSFIELGSFLLRMGKGERGFNTLLEADYDRAIEQSCIQNPWFTDENVKSSLMEIGKSLQKESIQNWLNPYVEKINQRKHNRVIGIIMAGNIPAVGFHDFLCVLISGNSIQAKLSTKDNLLIPFFAEFLIQSNNSFKDRISFAEETLKDFNAVISTGSNTTSRYFKKYFSGNPNIIRHNRNSVAVLDGTEADKDLKALCKDIFQYFGLGCRNVSKLFVPEGYVFDSLFEVSEAYSHLANHHKYISNYIYNRTLYLMDSLSFLENGFLILKEEESYNSPVSVVYFEKYENINELNQKLVLDKEMLQCIVSKNPNISNAIPFGSTQSPDLWDYADGVDTMKFLVSL
jgi:hypothetical protein